MLFLNKNCMRLGLTALLLATAWGCDGLSSDEKKEFMEVTRALDALAGTHERDRGVRLEELENIQTDTARISALKKNCAASYQSFQNATRLLANARNKTAKTEAAVAKLREAKKTGRAIKITEEDEIKKLSEGTARSLEDVNRELNKAESLIAKCEEDRKVFELLISGD